jgi:ABC-type Mn2+/Zn2+ transport system ATPase subunit
MKSSTGAVEFVRCEDVQILVSGAVLLERVTKTIRAGTVTHLHGPNGSGKSTLLRVLAGCLPVASGRVVHALPSSDIFFLPQLQSVDVHLPFTLQEVSRLGRRQSAAVSEPLGAWFPTHLWNKSWNTASGGERMRALLARALGSDCRLLLLDEPFNHLDAEAVPMVMQALFRHVVAKGGGVVLVSHQDVTAASAADGPSHADLCWDSWRIGSRASE